MQGDRRHIGISLLILRLVAWFLAITIVIFSLVPANIRPVTGAPQPVEHFAIYALTGLAFGFGYKRREVLLAGLLVIFSGAVEFAQLAVPGRHARVSDFVIDAIAVVTGLFVASHLSRYISLR